MSLKGQQPDVDGLVIRELVRRRIITQKHIDEAVPDERPEGADPSGAPRRLLDALLARGLCTEAEVREIRAACLSAERVAIVESELDPEVIDLIKPELAYRHQVLPLSRENGLVRLAMADVLDVEAIDDVRLITGLDVEPVLADPREIRRLVENYYMQSIMDGGAEEGVEVIHDADEDIGDLERMAREALVIKAVNHMIRQAVLEGASDIHIEPFERDMKVRFRIDGVLQDFAPPAKRYQAAIVSRVKIMAQMDIAERRLPQDGRISIRIMGRDIDLRVSTVPTLFGESVVMRILDKSSVMFGLTELGMQPVDLTVFTRFIGRPHGIILVTGPTGSGKTTTLYAALRAAFSAEKKIITIEDPVEYQLDGVNQIEVRPRIGLTFASGLRHIVRQDPDIILVGEIRDHETADIAIHSALTGHLVLSTLHTNDAPGAVTRLVDMGIEPFLVASTLVGAVAQRLVRVLCDACKEPWEFDAGEYPRLGDAAGLLEGKTVYRPRGCDQCRFSGYRGRTAVFEILTMSEPVERMILRRASTGEIREQSIRQGMRALRQDGVSRVIAGTTSVEEIIRVTQEEMESHKPVVAGEVA